MELEESLRNGVLLAKLGHCFAPSVVPLKKIYDMEQLRYQVGNPGPSLLPSSSQTTPSPRSCESRGGHIITASLDTWEDYQYCWVSPSQRVCVSLSSSGHPLGGCETPAVRPPS